MFRTRQLCVFGAIAIVAAAFAASTAFAQQRPPSDEALIDSLLASGRVQEAREKCEVLAKASPDNPMAWFLLARARHADGDYAGAIKAGKRAAEFPAVRASAYYNLACAYALSGRSDDALDALHLAERAGFSDRTLMSTDPDLESVRGDPRFALPGERIYDVLDVGDTVGLPYSVDLPVDFDSTKAYPVLVGPGDADPASALTASLFWGEDSRQRGWIVVESPAFVVDNPVEKTRKLLDHIAATYHVALGKFDIAGYDVNSAGAFLVAAAMPERFHSVSGLPGYPPPEVEDLSQYKGVIVNFIVGENDEFWLNEARLAHQKLKKLGVETYLEIVPGGSHVLQELFGGEFMDRLDALRGR